MPIIGDTVRLKVEFKTFAGALLSPNNVKLKIYEGTHTLVTTIDITPYAEGKCQYDYTIPVGVVENMYFEFGGTLEDKPILGRMKILREWAD